jgi:hypothetical protein
MSSTVARLTGALRTEPQEQPEGYAFCANDSFWFRPAYTDGRCPLCGEVAPGGAPPLPLLARLDRAVLGMAALGLVSIGMSVLVLVMYFQS